MEKPSLYEHLLTDFSRVGKKLFKHISILLSCFVFLCPAYHGGDQTATEDIAGEFFMGVWKHREEFHNLTY